MTEAEITYQLSEVFNRWWVINQWWASISFALLAVAHFASNRLNYLIMVVVLALYTGFSVWMWSLWTFNGNVISAFNRDLSELQVAGSLSTNGANAFINNADLVSRYALWGRVAVYGTFASVICYVIYSVVQASRHVSAGDSS